MSDYDFKQLNDKEFEILCVDIIGKCEGKRFERFKPGKDAGVDGRFFANSSGEAILQCKHWANTPFNTLLKELKDIERPKVERLKPARYFIAVSNPLSRRDKTKIAKIFAPYLISESDVYGKEDLNDLITSNPAIEQKHYKLWLHSSNVLKHVINNQIIGRSDYYLNDIIKRSNRYVVTKSHELAVNKANKLGVVIISGDPGVGKTTLADHLCLHYVAEGYELAKISNDIKEAESIFDHESKQLFYFDDFLGRNYLEALKGHEGNEITLFIRRVADNKNKRFILTSRSTIFNQGRTLIDAFDNNNISNNEFELRIKSLSDIEKAHILYNHIWHSDLGPKYIDQIYKDRRYRDIISHQNFNPRLISYITDASRLDDLTPEKYWPYILRSLNNPSQIWENPFIAQTDDFGRAIILLVVLHGRPISENTLLEAYQRFLTLPENANMHGRRDFITNLRFLTGSFLSRSVSNHSATIDLFNPSIGDYILTRYANDTPTLRKASSSLLTKESLHTLRSLNNNKIKISQLALISRQIMEFVLNNNFSHCDHDFVSELCLMCIEYVSDTTFVGKAIRNSLPIILSNPGSEDAYTVVKWAVENLNLSKTKASVFIANNIVLLENEGEIAALSGLLSVISQHTLESTTIKNELKEHVIKLIESNLTDYIDTGDIFCSHNFGDYDSATYDLKSVIGEKLDEMGIDHDSSDLEKIMDSYDLHGEMDEYFINSSREEDREYEGPVELPIDEIDDLFDRSNN